MPLSALPSNPSLEQLKKQAKDLLKAHKAADPRAVLRLQQSLPELSEGSQGEILQTPFSLKNAQLVIASMALTGGPISSATSRRLQATVGASSRAKMRCPSS